MPAGQQRARQRRGGAHAAQRLARVLAHVRVAGARVRLARHVQLLGEGHFIKKK